MSTLPSGYLRDDHRDIMKKLSRISDALHRLAQDGTLTDESLLRLARTLDHEIERHFMKEEHVLEAALENVKPEERGEIKEILEDHERLRQEMGEFQAAAGLHEEGHVRPWSNAQATLIRRGHDLVLEIVQHMQREENGFFLDADRLLTPKQKRQVVQRLKETDIWNDLSSAPPPRELRRD